MAGSDHVGRRRRRFQPFKKLQRLFTRRGKVHCGSGVTSEVTTPTAESPDVQTDRASSGDRRHSQLSESRESVLAEDAGPSQGPSHHQSSASIPSLPSSSSQLTAELRNVLTKKRSDGADDDSGLPRTPTTSPGVRPQQVQAKGSGARWGGSVSDGSLLSIYSSGTGTDEEPFGPLSSHSSKLSLARDNESADLQLESEGPLSHAAAKHRIAVRPRRTRRPRTRGTALPATLEEGSPGTETAPTPDTDTGGAGGRRSPSASPERVRTRSTLPAISDGATEESPPAVQRSRSSLTDHRLRHLSPRKLFSRGGDSGAEKRSDGGGFFSRIFGSRRSGRKAKFGRETEPSSAAEAPTEGALRSRVQQSPGPTEQRRDRSSSGTAQTLGEQRSADEQPPQRQKRTSAAANAEVAESTQVDSGTTAPCSGIRAELPLQDIPGRMKKDEEEEDEVEVPPSPDPQCEACRESEQALARRHSKNEIFTQRLSKQMDDALTGSTFKDSIESEETSQSEGRTVDSDSSECSSCLTDTASEGSPCILRRRNRTPEASDSRHSSVASDLQSRSSPGWADQGPRKSPPRADIDRRTWTEPDPQKSTARFDAEFTKSSPLSGAELRRSFPRYSAEERKLAAISSCGGHEQTQKSVMESTQPPSRLDKDKRKTYTVSDDQNKKILASGAEKVESMRPVPENTEEKSVPMHEAKRQQSTPETYTEGAKSPSKPARAYRRSLPAAFLGASQTPSAVEQASSAVPVRPARSRPRSVSKLASDGSERHSAQPPAAASAAEPSSSSSSSPESPRRPAAGFGVVLRSVSRTDPVDSGPQSLDSAALMQPERAQPATRRRRSSPGREVNAIARAFQSVPETKASGASEATAEKSGVLKTSDRDSDSDGSGANKQNPSETAGPGCDDASNRAGSAVSDNVDTVNKTPAVAKELHGVPPPVKPKPSCPNGTSPTQKTEESQENDDDGAVGDASSPAVISATSSPCVPEFMKVQLHPVDAPLHMVSQVVVPKRPAPMQLATPAAPKKPTEPAEPPRALTQSTGRVSTGPVTTHNDPRDGEKAAAAENSEPASKPPVPLERKVAEPVPVSPPSPDECKKDTAPAATPPPPSKSPESVRSASSAKESPVLLRKKSAQASEESELAKVFKRRSLKMVGTDETSQKLQPVQPEPEQTKLPAAPAPAQEKKPELEPAPAPAWRGQKHGAGVTRDVPAPWQPSVDSSAARPWKPAPSLPSKVRPAVSNDSRPSVTAEPRQASTVDDGATVAAETAAAAPRPAAPVPAPRQTPDSRPKDDDSASTADWLKQTVRERREQREQRELKHLRQPHPKELIIEPETLVPGRSPAPRSSRVLAMANTFQKLQPT